eukprot:3659479-Amphidinium_carterae.1
MMGIEQSNHSGCTQLGCQGKADDVTNNLAQTRTKGSGPDTLASSFHRDSQQVACSGTSLMTS